jgi:hypothetical protein
MRFYNINKKFSLFIILILLSTECHRRGIHTTVDKPPAPPVSFKSIAGISYSEVRRKLSTGLSFDPSGFQTAPSYKITFLTNDSASVYSPDKKAFINFLVFLEQDSIFNVARSYFKMLKMNKDSLLLRVLEVQSDTLHLNHSLVYMTFYANNYIKSHHIDTATMARPDRRDTLYIQHKSILANKYPDSAFAARVPVTITSKSPLATVEKKVVKPDVLNNFDASDSYLNPEFNIMIHKAYENFSYSFLVYVDADGNMIFDKSIDYIMPEYRDYTIKVMKAITTGYLKFDFTTTPGSTLGIKHTSVVILNVVGRK